MAAVCTLFTYVSGIYACYNPESLIVPGMTRRCTGLAAAVGCLCDALRPTLGRWRGVMVVVVSTRSPLSLDFGVAAAVFRDVRLNIESINTFTSGSGEFCVNKKCVHHNRQIRKSAHVVCNCMVDMSKEAIEEIPGSHLQWVLERIIELQSSTIEGYNIREQYCNSLA